MRPFDEGDAARLFRFSLAGAAREDIDVVEGKEELRTLVSDASEDDEALS